MGLKLFVLLVTVSFLYIAWPFLLPLAMGAVVAALLHPYLQKWKRKRIGAAVLTIGVTLVLFLPAGFLIFVGAKSAFLQLQGLRSTPQGGGDLVDAFLSHESVHSTLESITHWFPIEMESLLETVQDLIRTIGTRLTELLGMFFSQLPGHLLALIISMVSVYFFLVDGGKLTAFVRRHSFFSRSQTDRALTALAGICRSVILASFVSGAVQAFIMTVVCLATGVPNAAMIGLTVFIASFVPLLGSAPVNFGIAIQQLALGHTVTGITLVVAAVVVAGLDNLIRPWFLRGSANLHPLLAFIATLGGLQMIGFAGVFIGPIIAALFLLVLDLFFNHSQTEISDSI